MKRIVTLSLLLVISLGLYSQSNDDSPILQNRDSFELRLFIDQEQFYLAEIPSEPFVFDDTILKVYTGEELFVELDFSDGKHIKTTVVDRVVYPEKTLRISLEQLSEDNVNQGTMLNISNPFDQVLEYQVIMNPFNENRYFETTTLPIQPGLSNYEHWPEALTSLVFLDFRLK